MQMLILYFFITLNFQKIAVQASIGKRSLQRLPLNVLTFVAYDKRMPTFAEYGKRTPKFAEYRKRNFSGVGTNWIDKYNALMQ